MSDDDASFRRRRRREGDSPADSNDTTGENAAAEQPAQSEEHGADWLLSQLDSDDTDTEATNAIPVTDAADQSTPVPADEPTPDLTPWWRNSAPAPAPSTPANTVAEDEDEDEDEDVDTAAETSEDTSEDTVQFDMPAAPEPARRSTFQAFTPEPPEAEAAEALGDVDKADQASAIPSPAPAVEPPMPEPVVAPVAAPTPPLFKPRPDNDRPWVTKPLDGPVQSRHTDGRTDYPAVSDRETPPSAEETKHETSEPDLNESAPFAWSLTPNDELDPIVHKTSSTPEPAPASTPVTDAKTTDAPKPQPESDAAETAPFIPVPASAPEPLAPEPLAPTAAFDFTPVIPELVDEGDDETPLQDIDVVEPELLDEDIVDAEIVDAEIVDAEIVESSESTSSEEPAPRKAAYNTEDIDSLAFLIELEAATAATVALNAADSTDDDDATQTVAFESAAEDAPSDPFTRHPVAAATPPAAFASEAPTALFPPVGPPTDTAPPTGSPSTAGTSERPPLPPYVKWIALGVAALLVLVGLFFLGTRLPSLFGGPAAAPAPTVTPTETPTETPTPTPTEPPAEDVVTVGPVAPGEHKWNALLGGECLEPYATPWAENFTVVDCAAPHKAQMVFTAPVTSDPAAPYPGEAEIASQIALWCSAPGVLDAAAAGAFTDLQVQGTYPVSEEQWADGERNYFCFLSRSTGEPLTGTLAIAQPAT